MSTPAGVAEAEVVAGKVNEKGEVEVGTEEEVVPAPIKYPKETAKNFKKPNYKEITYNSYVTKSQ